MKCIEHGIFAVRDEPLALCRREALAWPRSPIYNSIKQPSVVSSIFKRLGNVQSYHNRSLSQVMVGLISANRPATRGATIGNVLPSTLP